jgi:GAF domain-containing protein
VGHVHGGDTERALQAVDLGPRAVAQLGIEVAQRFVEQHGVGRLHDGPRHGDALLLAARQLDDLRAPRSPRPTAPGPRRRGGRFGPRQLADLAEATFSNTLRCGQMA